MSEVETKEVALQDQQKISEFAQIAEAVKTLRQERKALAEEIDLLDEVAGEIMLSDDLRMQTAEGLMYRMGDVFLELDQDEHDRLVDEDSATAKAKRSDLATRIANIEARQAELKAELYSLFGSQIALETDD